MSELERFESGFAGHGRGVVISNDGYGNFSERGMTPAELEARRWALSITDGVNDLYCLGSAAFIYHRVWEFVALAIADAIAAEQLAQNAEVARLRQELEWANARADQAERDLDAAWREGETAGYEAGYRRDFDRSSG
jgi:hypothetical protein